MTNFQILQQDINQQATEICRTLHNAGYQAFIVGGCVRDLLLGVKPKDWDITTNATPEKIMELFPKTYPTGIQHGTVTVSMGEGIENHFEVTTFRIEGEYKDGRRPEEVFFVMNVDQDLGRRDLTINAIAYNPLNNQLIDPFGGIQDLQYGIIRAVGLPDARFQEDGLRIMRVARFAARFGYEVDQDTLNGMKNNLETLKKVSKERIKDELCKTLMTNNPTLGFSILKDVGALKVTCPILSNSTLPNLDRCQGDLETRLAYLYINNTSTNVQEEMTFLKFSNKEIKRTLFLLELFGRAKVLFSKGDVSSYISFMAHLKNFTSDTSNYTLEQFIKLSNATGNACENIFEKYKDIVVYARRDLKIDGFDLMTMGRQPGPQIKTLLEECYLEILQNPNNNNRIFLLGFVSGK